VAKACPITELDLCRNNKQCAVATHGHKGAQLHAWSHSPWERKRERERERIQHGGSFYVFRSSINVHWMLTPRAYTKKCRCGTDRERI